MHTRTHTCARRHVRTYAHTHIRKSLSAIAIKNNFPSSLTADRKIMVIRALNTFIILLRSSQRVHNKANKQNHCAIADNFIIEANNDRKQQISKKFFAHNENCHKSR